MKTSLFYLIISTLAFVIVEVETVSGQSNRLWLGADLSYVNEIEDCGGIYKAKDKKVDPFEFFARSGANLTRVRLWHTPDWTKYSNLIDVRKTIKRAKATGMSVLLDFHYSDTWADPNQQLIPKAWSTIGDLEILQDSIYEYTYNTLRKLDDENLVPEFVQVGNETNIEILQQENDMVTGAINWGRNLLLINAGLRAVRDFSRVQDDKIQSMIHISQPENALWWFNEAVKNGIDDFEWIGLSYYPKWSSYGLDSLFVALDSLKKTYQKKIMIVETAYPYSFVNVDSANNILGEDSLIPDFLATPDGQLEFMNKLTEVTLEGGGQGVIYWEPAWISSKCSTRWGKGSHWENATFFDASNNNEALKAFNFYSYMRNINLKTPD